MPDWAGKRPFLVMLAAGALSACGFAPLHIWQGTILSIALLLALLAQARTGRRAASIGYAYGLGQFMVGLNWIAFAFTFQDAMPHWFGYGAVFLLSLYLAVYPAVATLLAWRLARRGGALALTLALSGAWALTEYLRATLFTGFAWNPLGVIWLGTGVESMARMVGTYGLGSIVVLTAGAAWMGLRGQRRLGAAVAGTLAALLALTLIHGVLTRPASPAHPVAIRVIQPNIGQDAKYDSGLELRNYQKLARLSGAPTTKPRLIFWPEAAVYAILDQEPQWREALATLLGPDDLLMTGGDKYHYRKGAGGVSDLAGANNSLWVVTPDARLIGRYDKSHLVPYGEYLPMRPILSAIGLSRLVPGDMDFWPGPGPRTLDLPAASGRPPLKMGVQICYEIIFSGQVVDEAHRPDFLFNPSNDAWFGSWGPPQHLAQARLRAVEEGVPVIRSTPTGISAVVDASGGLVASLGHHQAGHIDTILPPAAEPTLFARLGNTAPVVLAVLLMLSGVALGRVKR